MDNNNNISPEVSSGEQFGMTQEELNTANRRELLFKLKTILASIEPVIINLLKTITYYLIKFIKAFISASVRMIMGKEV